MTTGDLDRYFRSFLDIDSIRKSDNSLNGLQVDNDGTEITKVAFAVDACLETFERAADCGAGLLFVHHGIFWGEPLAVRGSHRRRLEALLRRNLALYAVHLPLDQHPVYGNNAVLAAKLGLEDIEPFGEYHGIKIGYKGRFPTAATVDEAVRRIAYLGRPPLAVLPFGVALNRSCAVVSGGAAQEARQAITEGIDLYVTGEASHEIYHESLEAGLNYIAAGHYSSEIGGVRSVMAHLAQESGLETEFIDTPTGL